MTKKLKEKGWAMHLSLSTELGKKIENYCEEFEKEHNIQLTPTSLMRKIVLEFFTKEGGG